MTSIHASSRTILTVSAAGALIVNVLPWLSIAWGVADVTATVTVLLSVSTISSYKSFLTDDESLVPDDEPAASASS